MDLSILRFILLSICFILLIGCVTASDWLSREPPSQNSLLIPSDSMTPIQIGNSIKQDVESNFGRPSDRQLHSIDGLPFESFSYTTVETTIRLYQYLPFFGALAFRSSPKNQTPSVAISFSPEGTVSGMTLSTINAYGDIPLHKLFAKEKSPYFYGVKNPDVFYAVTDSTP